MILAEGFGNAEIGLTVGTSSMLLLGLLAFLGRNVLSDIRAHNERLAHHDTKHALADDRHGTLLQDVKDLKADMRVVRTWVDSQGDPSQHRRRTD